MKKTLIALSIAAMAVGMVACNKEEKNAADMRFTASIEGYANKTVLTGENLTWATDDEIAVYGTGGGSTFGVEPGSPNARTATFTNVSGDPGSAPYKAFYPTTLTTDGSTIVLPEVQHSSNGALTGYPMYAEANNYVLAFKNLCSVMKLSLTKNGASVSKIQLVTDQLTTGTFDVSYNGGNPTIEASSTVDDHTSIVTLVLDNAVDISTGADFYLYLPANSYKYIQIKVYDANGLLFTKALKDETGIAFARSQYNYLTLGEDDIEFHHGELSGEFSVSATKKVTFSRSNLFYNPTTNQFVFADYQYANGNGMGMSNNGCVFHFQNYANRTSYNVYYNGTITDGGWYNMPSTEVDYMLTTRRTAVGYNGMLCQVTMHTGRTRGGLLVFPDDFVWPLDESKKPFTHISSTTAWNGITFTYDEWRVLEDAGCAFLPVTGYVSSSDNNYLTYSSSSLTSTQQGHYWSSTVPSGSSTGSNASARYTYFTSTAQYFPGSHTGAQRGLKAIRLVREVE